jgi:hypothetical protein
MRPIQKNDALILLNIDDILNEIEPYMCPCYPQACEKINLLQNLKINNLSEVTQ